MTTLDMNDDNRELLAALIQVCALGTSAGSALDTLIASINELVLLRKAQRVRESVIATAQDADAKAAISRAALESTHDTLRTVLRELLDRYVSLVRSGDCGFWDPEAESVVKDARKVLDDAN